MSDNGKSVFVLQTEETAEEIRQSMMDNLITARLNMEQRMRNMAKGIERLGERIAPKGIDALRKKLPFGITFLQADEILQLIAETYESEKDDLWQLAFAKGQANARKAQQVELEQALKQAERCESEAMQAKADAQELRVQLREMEARLMAQASDGDPQSRQELMKAVMKCAASSSLPWTNALRLASDRPELDTSSWPGWAKAWSKTQTFKRDVDVVLVLGDTGVPTLDEMKALIAELHNIQSNSGSIQRMLKRLKKLGVIEQIVANLYIPPWKPSHLLRLTDKGREIYRLVRGCEAVEPWADRLLERHGTPERVSFVVDAARLLGVAGGFKILLTPAKAAIDDGEYAPDLAMVVDGGEIVYVLCEMGLQDDDDHERRWEQYAHLADERIYLVAPSASRAESISAGIESWAEENGHLLPLWLADLERSRERSGLAVWLQRPEEI